MLQHVWTDFWQRTSGRNTSRISPVNDKCCCLDSVFFLLECPDLKMITSVEISDCTSLDPTSLIDICSVFHCLKYFIYRNCTQFNQYHLMRIGQLCCKLEYIDGKGAGRVSATYALGLISNLPRLSKIAVTPLQHEGGACQFMIFQYSRIIFGDCIVSEFNTDGNYYRFAANALKEVSET